MRITSIGKLVVAIIIVGILIFPVIRNHSTSDEIPEPKTGVTKAYLLGGICDIAVIYLSYEVPHDNSKIPTIRDILTTSSVGFYSVQSFYEKYGVHMRFKYYEFTVTSVDPELDWLPYHDGIWRSWISANQQTFKGVYDSCDILAFFLDGKNAYWTCGGVGRIVVGMADAQWIPGNYLYTLTGYRAQTIAHELGHCFGGHDHYNTVNPDGSPSSIGLDADCVMNRGGGDTWQLRTSTIFGPVDLQQDVHFDYIIKQNFESYLKRK